MMILNLTIRDKTREREKPERSAESSDFFLLFGSIHLGEVEIL